MPRWVVPMGMRFSRASDIFSTSRWNGKITCARLLMRSCPATSMPSAFKRVDLLQQRRQVNHHAVADHSHHAGAQHAAGDQFQNEFALADEYGMTRRCARLDTAPRYRSVRPAGRPLCLCPRRPIGRRERSHYSFVYALNPVGRGAYTHLSPSQDNGERLRETIVSARLLIDFGDRAIAHKHGENAGLQSG